MSEPNTPSPRADLETRLQEAGGLDTVDMCRMRLLSLRTRVEANWPQTTGRFVRHGGMRPALQATISDLLAALPSPLPLSPGADPECLFSEGDTDLCVVAGRAVDAGLALLEGATMEKLYNGHIMMLESYHPDAPEPIVVPYPTVGLLVSTIIGTLEAVSELILEPEPGKPAKTEPRVAVKKPLEREGPAYQPEPETRRQRGPSVPRV